MLMHKYIGWAKEYAAVCILHDRLHIDSDVRQKNEVQTRIQPYTHIFAYIDAFKYKKKHANRCKMMCLYIFKLYMQVNTYICGCIWPYVHIYALFW